MRRCGMMVVVLISFCLFDSVIRGQALPRRVSDSGGRGEAPLYPTASPRPLALSNSGDTVRFDPKHLRLQWDHRRWHIGTADGMVLKDFGPAESEARRALRLIHELGLNEYGTIGKPRPVLEYWLVDGRAPRALVRSDLRSVPFETTSLRIEKISGQWAVCDKTRVLFTFENEADASQALDLFQKHRFSQAGVIGLGTPLMTVFFTSGNEGPTIGESGRQMSTLKFPRFAKNTDGNPRIEQVKNKETGLEGVVQAVIPPIDASRGTTTAPPMRGLPSPSLTDRKALFWRSEPRLSREAQTTRSDGGRVAFDWRHAQLRNAQGDWVIGVGGQTIARFGTNVSDGRTVLSAIRYYRCHEFELLGGDLAGLWCAVPGSSPRGAMFGLSAVPIRPDKLEISQVSGRYSLCENGRVVVPVGERAEDARRLLELIRRHGYDRVCPVGSGPEGVAFLVRSR